MEFPHHNLSEYFRKIYSQTYEDSVLEHLYSIISPRKKYYVEFGGAIGQCHGNTSHYFSDIVYPPYMQQEKDRFYGQRDHLDDRFIWKLMK